MLLLNGKMYINDMAFAGMIPLACLFYWIDLVRLLVQALWKV